MENSKRVIEQGKAILGLELGSTRIKAVLVDPAYRPIAQGSHTWENRFENGLWTYSLEDVWAGIADCYADLVRDVREKYDTEITTLGSIGISAMMHGYLIFDKDDQLLVPFRTWRNTNTEKAAGVLSELFKFNIPLRWSISHYYQAILDSEPHVDNVAFLTTLAGYVHWRLSGEKVIGIGDASGIMPVDSTTRNYDSKMIAKFEDVTGRKGFERLLPRVLMAGEKAGNLTAEGARLLDLSGRLCAGTPMCPPEGDAGTGMVATNAVRPRTGNVSAGTSAFSMIVLDKELSQPYRDIDMVTTPVGDPVAMVHVNNCTSDLNAWVGLFNEFARLSGSNMDMGEIFSLLYTNALKGDADCGGLVAFNFLSGEPIAEVYEGRPLFVRSVGDRFTLANFIRTHLNSAVACLSLGNEILFDKEKVKVDRMTGHGGFFKTPEVGQRIMAAALNTPVSVMETAGEGGAWGMAILAGYAINNEKNLSLADYLEQVVFEGNTGVCIAPAEEEIEGFRRFLENYRNALPIEKTAVSN